MTKQDDDAIKNIFGKSAKEIFSSPAELHSKYHSPNAFCGNAGPEELKHFQDLLDNLTDTQVVMLIDAVSIRFGTPTKEISRDTLENVLDEADREDFYREYRKLIANK